MDKIDNFLEQIKEDICILQDNFKDKDLRINDEAYAFCKFVYKIKQVEKLREVWWGRGLEWIFYKPNRFTNLYKWFTNFLRET